MFSHPPLSIVFVAEEEATLVPLLSYLRSISHVHATVRPRLPGDVSDVEIVVTTRTDLVTGDLDALARFVDHGGGWLHLVTPSSGRLPDIFGAQPVAVGAATELRVLFKDSDHPMAVRLPDAVYLSDCSDVLEATRDDTETVLYADWHYEHKPVLVTRRVGAGQVACTTLRAFGAPAFQQILYRGFLLLAGRLSENRDLGIGLLGYPPHLGRFHGLGVRTTEGLSLVSVCDLSQERLAEAQTDLPRIKTCVEAVGLADDADVDLVIVATPPNTHAALCLQMMGAGKHVVCEKPLALNRAETASMIETAERRKVHLSCHQNRRWDVDYLAIRQAVADGLIGELFYLESFVGGFSHPCGYWHSHAPISGGTAYDWGGHYIDWILSLVPDRPTSVIGTRHKRVWHDVTNADQERVQVRFAGGQEAEFVHSDIAAVRKPKWYLLGTEGAIVGHWHDVTAYDVDPVFYYQRHEIAATEMPPDLTLQRRHRSGRIVTQELALPERQQFPFHQNLADHLLTGESIVTPVAESVRVVAVLETAARSAAKGGTVEPLDE